MGFASTSEAFDTTTAMGRAMLGVAAVFAQLTREMIAENVQDGLSKRARAGKYNGPKNPAPYGYDYSVEQGKLLINQEEAKVIRRIFELYGRRKWGQMKICRHLNEQGLQGKRGGQWSAPGVRRLLASPLYVGKVRSDGEDVPGEHEGIVDSEVYEETQSLLRQRSKLPPRSQQSQHLLSGIARCGKCEKRLVAHWARKRGKPAYRFYHHRRGVYTDRRHCTGVSKSADTLEAVVVAKVREVATSAEFQEAAFAEARKQLASDLPRLQDEREEVSARLAEMAQKFEGWAERLDAGLIDEDQFRSRNAALLAAKEKLQTRLAELEAQEAESESVEVSLEEVKGALQDFDRVWDHMTQDERREMLRSLIEDFRVWRERAQLKLVLFPPMEIPVVFKRGPAPKSRAQCQ